MWYLKLNLGALKILLDKLSFYVYKYICCLVALIIIGGNLMNKNEFVSKLAAKADTTKKDAEKFLAAFQESVTEALKRGDKIQLVGFGTFEVANRAERTCRNPRTGENMTIPAMRVPKFKPGKLLKDSVSN